MRWITSEHLRHEKLDREKVLACMTHLMNAAHFRVGEERYAKKNKTYDIATLRRKHLKIGSDAMVFEYTGVCRSKTLSRFSSPLKVGLKRTGSRL
jgi:DNA topoisomerase IB